MNTHFTKSTNRITDGHTEIGITLIAVHLLLMYLGSWHAITHVNHFIFKPIILFKITLKFRKLLAFHRKLSNLLFIHLLLLQRSADTLPLERIQQDIFVIKISRSAHQRTFAIKL